MNTYKNEIITTFSIAYITLLALLLPTMATVIMLAVSVVIVTVYTIVQNYDINYKYWFSFIGQLLALIFVVVSFVAGLSFIANSFV